MADKFAFKFVLQWLREVELAAAAAAEAAAAAADAAAVAAAVEDGDDVDDYVSSSSSSVAASDFDPTDYGQQTSDYWNLAFALR